MKKIKIAFASLSAVAGIGGAYATMHPSESSSFRVAQTYTWRTIIVGKVVYTSTTVSAARFLSDCTGDVAIPCLRGTAPGIPPVTLFSHL
ncbi:hypothetical protein [Chitinophaga flava]|uniref:hypothetical protein n=1 Tax=Chitinophaga flava TaxID=2259036 RepID=UPI0011BE8021|nr:hypothetical protein [Chitinophaga flava]